MFDETVVGDVIQLADYKAIGELGVKERANVNELLKYRVHEKEQNFEKSILGAIELGYYFECKKIYAFEYATS